MIRLFIHILGLIVMASSMVHAQTQHVVGSIYEDINKNGKKDKNEPGIPGVKISNGRDVVRTDSKGNYTLPIGDDDIVFVMKPSDYCYIKDSKGLPHFYYVHKPKGSPAILKHEGVKPTGPLPSQVDFGLIREIIKPDFSVLLFGDPQLYNVDYVPVFQQAILDQIEGEKVDFGIVLGDMVVDNLDVTPLYLNAMNKTGVLWHHVLGNHDINMGEGVTDDSLSDETFEAIFGPATYAFDHGQAHFIILDNILYPDPRRAIKNHTFTYWHGFTDKQIEFLKSDLDLVDKDQLVVIAMHASLDGIPYSENNFNPLHKKILFDLVADFKNVLVLSGHSHIQRNIYYKNGESNEIHEYNVGTTSGGFYAGALNKHGLPDAMMQDGTPQGFGYLNVSGNQYSLEWKVADPDQDPHMTLFIPKRLPFGRFSHSTAYVNFYMGDSKTEVDFRIDQGDWKPMESTTEPDLLYLQKIISWDLADDLQTFPARRPYDAQPNTHLWRTWFPRGLNEGKHVFEVRVTDRYGNRYYRSEEFFVEKQMK